MGVWPWGPVSPRATGDLCHPEASSDVQGTMASGMDSKAAFTSALESLELTEFAPTMKTMGITTYSDLAFCTPAGSGERDTAAFEDIIKKLVCEDPNRDCFMGQCQRCQHHLYNLAEKVREMFFDLEYDEVTMCFDEKTV